MRQFMQRLRDSAASFRRQEGGNVLIMFGAVLPAFLGLTVAVIDYSRASAARAELQNGLDSATLFVARSEAVTNAQAQTVGDQVLRTNMAGNTQGTLTGSNFRIEANQRVVASASASVPVSVMGLFGSNVINVSTSSEVTRSSNSVEVGIALDITGSMAGSRLTDMKAAAKELVDIIVKDVQTPHYSKVALIPYANAVNVGNYANSVRGTLTSGTSQTPGSQSYQFRNNSNAWTTYSASTCVTERTGTSAYTNVAPTASARVGRHYIGTASGDGNVCPTAQIVPLTTNRTTLKNNIDTYQARGSTAGHIGLAWAWYMVSESFGYLFPAASQPGEASDRELIKVVILMTDGDFNTAHADGVLSRDSGFGSNAIKINKDATNGLLTPSPGSSHNQAMRLCANIKSSGVLLYTVGFSLSSTASRNLMRDCATSAAHAYLPSSGTDLRDAFRAIGNEINSLRISR